jgi:hypothetical protein
MNLRTADRIHAIGLGLLRYGLAFLLRYASLAAG